MLIAVSAREAQANRVGNTFPGMIEKPFYRSLYFGSPPAKGGNAEKDKMTMPQAYLIEQPENSTVAAHYHDTNQFQIFVHGSGAFGKKPFSGLMVHYAKAHTTYGPIAAGENGAHYMTLRNNWDSGAKRMPENRAKLRKIKRLHRVADDVPLPDTATLKSISIEKVNLIPLEADGLGVCLFNFGPGQDCSLTLETGGAGAYAFVAVGSVQYDELEYETMSLIYSGPEEAPLRLTAGIDGASVLFLQFPPEPDDE
ncbi:MAG: hypothetical protein CMP14_03215 [Rickettsiales bacterium]|nr:hypothetical protein [Rickettsiales bacterium]